MSIVALITDFGLSDEYVGVMKGVILSVNPSASIIDITHSIPRHDVIAGALCLERSFKYFPEKTVFVVVVDPGVGGERRPIIVCSSRRVFIGPDNGVMTPVLDGADVFLIERGWLKDVSSTFHGRDIFAPVAGLVSKGVSFKKLGRRIHDPVVLRIPKPEVKGTKICGEIIHIDAFGNAITNISKDIFEKFTGAFVIEIGEIKFYKISKSYSDVEVGKPVCVWGSSFTLEIAVRDGSAADKLDVKKGDKVVVKFD